MALFNKSKREINAKIVYFGPPLSGKATTLQFIHRKLKPECRGPMKTMGGQLDRLLFFDFMPPELGMVNDYRVRFHLYTVQGDVANPSTWKTVLKGADGVVFVADAAPQSRSLARENFERLRECLRGYGQELDAISCVIQCNKGDLPDALDIGEMAGFIGSGDLPIVKTVARTGEGVLQVLSTVVKGVMNSLRDKGAAGAAALVPVTDLREAEVAVGSGLEEREANESAPPPADPLVREEATHAPIPTLSMGREAMVTPDGILRVPLTVGCGGSEKEFVLSIALTSANSLA